MMNKNLLVVTNTGDDDWSWIFEDTTLGYDD